MTKQWALTKDNIMVAIDASVQYRVHNPKYSVYAVQNVDQAVIQLTYATLRTIIGQYILQDLQEKRESVRSEIAAFVYNHALEWGVEITNVIIKEITLDQDM